MGMKIGGPAKGMKGGKAGGKGFVATPNSMVAGKGKGLKK